MTAQREQSARHRAALRTVGLAERAAGLQRLGVPRRYLVADGIAWRDGASLRAAPPEVAPVALPGGSERVLARVKADLVRFGKFDRDGAIRARAYLLSATPTALKVQTDRPGAQHGIDHEVRARREVDALVPGLAPKLYGSGRLPRSGVSWMAEEVVGGRHPAGPEEVSAAADAVIGTVARLYEASGYTSEPAAKILEPRTGDRIDEVARREPRLARFLPAIHRLLAQGRDLEVAFAHGDLVGSNVLLGEDGRVVLVDWEFARRRPVADDVGNVLTQARRKRAAVEVIEAHLGGHVGVAPTSYSLREQLVVAQVRMLSWFPHRRERAQRAGRLDALARDTDRRLKVLKVLLG